MTPLPPTVWLLALSQALAMTVVSPTLSASAWVGSKLAGPDWATLPLAAQYLATLLLLSPVAWAMTRLGRRQCWRRVRCWACWAWRWRRWWPGPDCR